MSNVIITAIKLLLNMSMVIPTETYTWGDEKGRSCATDWHGHWQEKKTGCTCTATAKRTSGECGNGLGARGPAPRPAFIYWICLSSQVLRYWTEYRPPLFVWSLSILVKLNSSCSLWTEPGPHTDFDLALPLNRGLPDIDLILSSNASSSCICDCD